MSFADELKEGFAEMTAHAGSAVTFTANGTSYTLRGVFAEPSVAMQHVDAVLGRSYANRFTVRRDHLPVAADCPKVGTFFTEPDSGAKFRVTDIERGDPTDPTITYALAIAS